MTFKIGQIFEEMFPPEASIWCDENNAFVEEIETVTKLVDEEFLLAEAEYDDSGKLISEARYGTKQVERTLRRFRIVAIPEPTQEELQAQIQKQLTAAVQRVLDSKAQELNYDTCLSVCSYIDTGVPKFDAESRAFRKWRSAVWSKGYEIIDLVKSGEMAIPSEEELLAELPELVIEYTE